MCVCVYVFVCVFNHSLIQFRLELLQLASIELLIFFSLTSFNLEFAWQM